jgi:Uma2 family endonuclease
MTQAISKRLYTPEEYLAIEEVADHKSEYYEGEIFVMAGGNFNHNLIASNVLTAFNNALVEKPCYVFGSDMRLQLEEGRKYTYADVVILCGQPEFLSGRTDTLKNPMLIVEVLSPSTMKFDQEGKFRLYKVINSLTDYILIDQYNYYIQHYHKLEPDKWLLQTIQDQTTALVIETLNLTLPLKIIYNKVVFEERPKKTRIRKVK